MDPETFFPLLENGFFGVLSTVGADGYPYGIPLNYVFHEGAVFFHSAGEGKKLRNLAFSAKACFTVVPSASPWPETWSTRYQSIVLFGHVQQVPPEQALGVLRLLVEKYASGTESDHLLEEELTKSPTKVFQFVVHHASGKQNPPPKKEG